MSPALSTLEHLEVVGDCAYFRPVGQMTLEEASVLCEQAIVFARDRRIPKLLINVKALVGFAPPTLPQRYFFARRWATAARCLVQLALVVHPEMMDPEKFSVTVAHNAGLNADAFSDEREAITWLQGQAAQ